MNSESQLKRKRGFLSKFAPGQIILLSIFIIILIGAIILALPISQKEPISLLNIYFVATSVTCVTSLSPVPLTQFSDFGQLIILIMMQIGGLGLITLTLFTMYLLMDLGLRTQLIAGKLLEMESWPKVRELLFFIIGLTFTCEAIGAFFIFPTIANKFTLGRAIFLSIFHSVSSFCNAGFCLFPDGIPAFNENIPFLLITSLLMFMGSLGFITWHEISKFLREFRTKKHFSWSLHTRLIATTTIALLIFSTCFFWMLERDNSLITLSPFKQFLNSLFNAIANRNTGFLSVDIIGLHTATLFMIMIMAFIGAAPGSTGSGIKIATFAILIATLRATILDKKHITIKGRTIADDQIYKALSIIGLSLIWITIMTFLLLITESTFNFLDVVFEVFSAFATLGLSTGVTPFLSTTGKMLIMLTMIAGRVGSLTIILALKQRSGTQFEFEYPEERIAIN
ncbi:MAG: Ktr system potassium uptake protein B [candidate division TM6 bacterium GW2011_GWF2_32_72]|nr:MAG: Ktr system potassium uptake protein B [candidate division TM6 bacterium GW2011_GWF2_32_72]